jgi:hypothetical protein
MPYVELIAGKVTRKQPDAEDGLVEAPEWVTCGCLSDDGGVTYRPPPGPTLAERQAEVWDRIKAERDRRCVLGVKAGGHWFHSDPQKSRIQQLGLIDYIPPNTYWKTLTFTGQAVFVAMTPTLAMAIVRATAESDVAIHTAAEVHNAAMRQSATPEAYDFSRGWPLSIEDEAHDAGFQFDSARAA